MALGLTPTQIVNTGQHPLLAIAPHWERVLLKEIATVQNGAAFSSAYFTEAEGLPLIRIRDVGSETTENCYNGLYSPEYVVNDGDLLIGMDGDFRRAFWRGNPGLLNQRVCRVRITCDALDEKFLYFCLQPYLDAIHAHTSAVTVKHLSSRTVENVPLPLPPLGEQRRIVAKLEELFSELDDSVANLEAARARLQTYRQSMLKQAFEGRLTEKWRRDHADELESADQLLERIREERHARYQQQLEDWKAEVAQWEADGKPGKKPRRPRPPTDAGSAPGIAEPSQVPLPPKWSWVRIDTLGEVDTGVTPLKKRKDYYEDGEIPWVTSGALNETFVTEPSGYVTEKALEETNLKLFPIRTLLVAMYGEGATRGKASELTFASTTNQAIAAIVQQGTEERIRPYLKWFLLWNYDKIRRTSSGGVQPNLNLGVIKSTALPLPPVQEQERLVELLESRISYVAETERLICNTLQKVETLRQTILKRAFEGRLVSQDPHAEPASHLLARIRGQVVADGESAGLGEATSTESGA